MLAPGAMKSVARSCRLKSAKATATPASMETRTPRLRPSIGPAPRPTLPGDAARAGDLELVAFAPHRLHQDREVEFPASRYRPGIGGVGVLDPERDIALQLAVQS